MNVLSVFHRIVSCGRHAGGGVGVLMKISPYHIVRFWCVSNLSPVLPHVCSNLRLERQMYTVADGIGQDRWRMTVARRV